MLRSLIYGESAKEVYQDDPNPQSEALLLSNEARAAAESAKIRQDEDAALRSHKRARRWMPSKRPRGWMEAAYSSVDPELVWDTTSKLKGTQPAYHLVPPPPGKGARFQGAPLAGRSARATKGSSEQHLLQLGHLLRQSVASQDHEACARLAAALHEVATHFEPDLFRCSAELVRRGGTGSDIRHFFRKNLGPKLRAPNGIEAGDGVGILQQYVYFLLDERKCGEALSLVQDVRHDTTGKKEFMANSGSIAALEGMLHLIRALTLQKAKAAREKASPGSEPCKFSLPSLENPFAAELAQELNRCSSAGTGSKPLAHLQEASRCLAFAADRMPHVASIIGYLGAVKASLGEHRHGQEVLEQYVNAHPASVRGWELLAAYTRSSGFGSDEKAAALHGQLRADPLSWGALSQLLEFKQVPDQGEGAGEEDESRLLLDLVAGQLEVLGVRSPLCQTSLRLWQHLAALVTSLEPIRTAGSTFHDWRDGRGWWEDCLLNKRLCPVLLRGVEGCLGTEQAVEAMEGEGAGNDVGDTPQAATDVGELQAADDMEGFQAAGCDGEAMADEDEDDDDDERGRRSRVVLSQSQSQALLMEEDEEDDLEAEGTFLTRPSALAELVSILPAEYPALVGCRCLVARYLLGASHPFCTASIDWLKKGAKQSGQQQYSAAEQALFGCGTLASFDRFTGVLPQSRVHGEGWPPPSLSPEQVISQVSLPKAQSAT
ncbi:unnamed protein product [Chrysoparadoxa australica]